MELKGPSEVVGPAPAGGSGWFRKQGEDVCPATIPNMGPSGHREKGSVTQSGRTPTSLKVKEASRVDRDLPPLAGRERPRWPQGSQLHLKTQSLCPGLSLHRPQAPGRRALRLPQPL